MGWEDVISWVVRLQRCFCYLESILHGFGVCDRCLCWSGLESLAKRIVYRLVIACHIYKIGIVLGKRLCRDEVIKFLSSSVMISPLSL